MTTETPSPLFEDKNWDIAVACDINLSRCFGSKDGLPKGSFLDISSLAIANVLHDLGDETSSGSVLFTAVDNSTLNGEPHPKNYNTQGNCVYQGDNHADVNVVVAGILSDNHQSRLYERTDKSRQSTAVHELSHVLDSNNQQMQSSVKKHDRNHKFRIGIPTFATYFGLDFATYESVGLLSDNYYAKIGGAALSQIVWYLVNNRTISPKLKYKHYLSRPSEVKARETEKNADQYPSIISFISNRTEQNTNIDIRSWQPSASGHYIYDEPKLG